MTVDFSLKKMHTFIHLKLNQSINNIYYKRKKKWHKRNLKGSSGKHLHTAVSQTRGGATIPEQLKSVVRNVAVQP